MAKEGNTLRTTFMFCGYEGIMLENNHFPIKCIDLDN
ncbi:hypothetical protein C7374_101156 [Falsochrobactrum ovis]|uniref:Uncharacterized protein n=1 Tax=Falsochrobactrum ovis TaxID=1293442 RepID=A0A364JYM8_9HYPH|nr:hypothetical protein C7374_101156 [Falsochrobactrum ovis]